MFNVRKTQASITRISTFSKGYLRLHSTALIVVSGVPLEENRILDFQDPNKILDFQFLYGYH
jgi:hypothetical protein